MTTHKAGLGGTLPLVLARLISAALTFTIPLVLARVLELADYGTYKQLFLISQTLYYVLPFGVPQALFFFLPRADEGRPYLVQTLTTLLLVSGGLAALILLVIAPPLAARLQNPALASYFTPLLLYVVGLMGSYPLEVTLVAQNRIRTAAATYVISDALRAAVMIVPVALGAGLTGMLWALVGFVTLRVIVTWAVLVPASRGPLWRGDLLREQLRYALPFGAAMLLAIPQQYAHQYAVSAQVTPAMFAIYAVGCFQLPLVDMLYNPTSEVLMVRLGQLDRQGRADEGVDAFRAATSQLAFAFFPLAAFLFTVAPDFIRFLFGDRFAAAAPLFRIGLIAVVLASFPVDGALRATNQTRHIFVSYFVKAAVTVPFLVVGIRLLGMLGGMLAWAGAELVGKAVLLARLPRALSTPSHRLRLLEVLPGRALGQATAASVAAALLVVLVEPRLSATLGEPTGIVRRLIPLAILGVCFAIAYLAALRLLGLRPAAALLAWARPRTA